MLRITVEVLPYGMSDKKETISVLELWNTGKENKYGEHKYKYKGWWKEMDTAIIRNIPSGSVEHNRMNFVWILIYKVIHKTIEPFI